ncbi:hypothetical protein H5410_015195 [Solanum commersonii]|uniref:Uncharacterized protein n=1 Tax=Solanum commersonii TaxID=4109 RepID=A0A9J5ZTE7_SOLCO|nr:hypothetical protein H5410_015195 [Solanum commersonii]
MSGAILKPSKMSKAIWVYIGSTGIPHPGPSGISQGLRASNNRRRPMVGNISQGLRASNKRRRPMVGNISQGMHASNVPCAHRESDEDQ